jgi:hypothetical protein
VKVAYIGVPPYPIPIASNRTILGKTSKRRDRYLRFCSCRRPGDADQPHTLV